MNLFPLVLFDRYFPQIDTNYVIIDNEESSYQLVRKMIVDGARKNSHNYNKLLSEDNEYEAGRLCQSFNGDGFSCRI